MQHNHELIRQIDEILPQTQCTRCSFPSCLDYATAIANNQAKINQCPPGGDTGIAKLAQLLKQPILPLNEEHGKIRPRQVAVIDEEACIGCTLCIKACPVDAIIGSNKTVHTVITDYCTSCDLCIPACPVDCITMIDALPADWTIEDAEKSRQRFNQRNARIQKARHAREERLKQLASSLNPTEST